jgi:hypothetical protein
MSKPKVKVIPSGLGKLRLARGARDRSLSLSPSDQDCPICNTPLVAVGGDGAQYDGSRVLDLNTYRRWIASSASAQVGPKALLRQYCRNSLIEGDPIVPTQ